MTTELGGERPGGRHVELLHADVMGHRHTPYDRMHSLGALEAELGRCCLLAAHPPLGEVDEPRSLIDSQHRAHLDLAFSGERGEACASSSLTHLCQLVPGDEGCGVVILEEGDIHTNALVNAAHLGDHHLVNHRQLSLVHTAPIAACEWGAKYSTMRLHVESSLLVECHHTAARGNFLLVHRLLAYPMKRRRRRCGGGLVGREGRLPSYPMKRRRQRCGGGLVGREGGSQ
mmetsp:Transcript_71707/g.142184  ORF Transcript_71707/g.142184 Transcript_71707/m.142184 type:complete len:230 (-) Transcript_71707:2323-3012(-)